MNKNRDSSINIQPFGRTAEGKEVMLYSLTNENGLKVDITNYGGIIVRLFVPDRNGRLKDIVLGYNTLAEYIKRNSNYFGAIIGRVGNRIKNGKFTLNDKTYQLPQNENGNHLHGGNKGFDKVVWEAEPFIKEGIPGLNLRYLSKDGEEGYPGNLEVQVSYLLNNDNNLRIKYKATTDKPTPVNLTQHSYFNLKGEGKNDILDHIVKINADQFLPVDDSQIPTGEFRSVTGTPFDFTSPRGIGSRINNDNPQLKIGEGYDQSFVLTSDDGEFDMAAKVYEPQTGRGMEVWTTEPGVQFYTGNNLDGELGKTERPYVQYGGLCLETQHYPDSPNNSNFPSIILNPEGSYESITEFRFTSE